MKTGSLTDRTHFTGRLDKDFFTRDVLEVAPELVGKQLVIVRNDGNESRHFITEVEAYRGREDMACHASRGRTARTEIMFHRGGKIYVYFVYGMYWMLNVVTGNENDPQAALIRGVEGFSGPGKLTKGLLIDGSFYGEDLVTSGRMRIEDHGIFPAYKSGPRIGINYAGEPWVSMPWRFYMLKQ